MRPSLPALSPSFLLWACALLCCVCSGLAQAQTPAAKAVAPPSKEAATRIFLEAWKKLRPDFDVHSVEVLKSEAKQSQERRWITYKLAISATGTDKGSRSMYNKKYLCTPEDYSSVLKLDAGSWAPDESMIKNVNESRDCKQVQ